MKQFLPAILLLSLLMPLSGESQKSIDRKLILKTSVLPFASMFSSITYGDVGFEYSLTEHFRLDSDIGLYYRSPFSGSQEYSRGQFTNLALRYYLDEYDMPYFVALQYKYEHKKSVVEVDFSDAGYPYKKYVDADRHSNSLLLIGGMQRSLFFDWLMFEYYAGFGAEYRIGHLSGLVDYELAAVQTGEVDAVKWDDPKGRIIPGWTVGAKVGIFLNELNWSKLKRK